MKCGEQEDGKSQGDSEASGFFAMAIQRDVRKLGAGLLCLAPSGYGGPEYVFKLQHSSYSTLRRPLAPAP